MEAAAPVEALTQEILVRVGERYVAMFVRIWRPASPPRATVFCLHGFTGNGSDFDYLGAFLCRNGYLVVCPDMPGRGRSAWLGEGGYDLHLYYKCLGALGQFVGKQNHFIGSSWGGTILLPFLYSTRAKAARIVLNDVPMLGGPAVDGMRNELLRDSQVLFETRAAAEDYVRSTRAAMGPVEEPVFNRYVENKIVAAPGGGWRLAYDPAATGNFAAMMGRAYDLYFVAAKIDARMLFLFGRDSPFRDPAAVERARAVRPDFWCVDTIDAGHPPSLMTLDQALLILGFLSAA